MTTEGLNRRTALAGVAAIGLGGPLLAACSDDSADTAQDPGSPESPEASSDAPSESAAPPDSADALTTTAEVPVGGGVIFAEAQIVVTQPVEGEFKAFSSICPHQKCPVTTVTDTINCKCHGSAFALANGAVVAGPSTSGLSEAAIAVEGDAISLA